MRIGVIADDITGANATGVLLTKQGFSAATIVQGISFPCEYDAICIDTDSRYVSSDEARKRVAKATRFMLKNGVELLCKRIDSTLRGNVGIEIDTVLNELGNETVSVVVPSFPGSGRITVGGYLLVNSTTVQGMDDFRDPNLPWHQSFVPRVIAEQSRNRIALIDLEAVMNGKVAVAKLLEDYSRKGVRIVVVDAVTEEHIKTVAKAMALLNRSFIPVDPGPLSVAYSQARFGELNRSTKVLVTVGSVTSSTEQQLRYLINKWGIDPIYVRPDYLLDLTGQRLSEIRRAVAKGLERVKDDSVIVVTTCQPGYKQLDLSSIAQKEKTSQNSLAKRITDGLAEISLHIYKKSNGSISCYFSSGGDMSASLCKLSGASGIELIDEVFPLAAYGYFIEGDLDNVPVVTKGGLIGDKTAISKSIDYLFRKQTITRP